MVLFIKKKKVKTPSIPRPLLHGKRLLGDDLRVRDSPESSIAAKHAVIVMNGPREFTTELLEWALENIMASGAGYTVTLLGVMPWLNIPYTWSCGSEVVMGYPLPWLVVERIIKLRATWVVFDRDLRKNREFFAEKIPCNVVMMNGEGGVDMIKGQPMIDNGSAAPQVSPRLLRCLLQC
ncbi:hypothetical protein SLEP1_g22018 [Rubroshorea leprosula]|uniref:Uncharacterized protein n=1 Tax=Rubroshorea leprosula TaxID=152421 RepID=A0AAV5JJY1_9ROSI|nr:hypothetical protein SLEP1_g22018 [Rubroshorea leprosula]